MSKKKDQDVIRIKADWNIPYTHSAGTFATRFFESLRDAKRIMGVKCPKCRKVLIPPRSFCERCFIPIKEWIDVGETGTIEAVSINYMRYTGMPDPPYCIAFIRLDGADTNLMHFIGGVDLKDVEVAKEMVKIGRRVKAVWRAKRVGSMKDIRYFKPIK